MLKAPNNYEYLRIFTDIKVYHEYAFYEMRYIRTILYYSFWFLKHCLTTDVFIVCVEFPEWENDLQCRRQT